MGREIITEGIDKTTDFNGEIWECGTFQGDTALVVKEHLDSKPEKRILRCFDTFEGMPFSGPHDFHKVGSFNETSLESVKNKFADKQNISFHKGTMPETFSGLEEKIISVVNIDVDNYDSVKACLEWLYPRVHKGGYIIIDDYNCPNCPGAKLATEEFMADKSETLTAPGGPNPQAYFVKL